MSQLAARSVLLLLALMWASTPAGAQGVKGQVVDQTGLALPGATVEISSATIVLGSTMTAADGTFAFDDSVQGDSISVSLEGFETVTVLPSQAARIVLPLAHTSATTQVMAPVVETGPVNVPAIGTTLTADTLARMPSAQMKVRESLPLLPSVVRGNDGLLRLGGARPDDSPLLIDGFDVTDPAAGLSTVNLPFESIRAVQVLRDPMDVREGDLIGGVVRMETAAGQPHTQFGFQSVMPRPRLASPGFGRIDAISPRVFLGGTTAGGKLAYFLAAEYDFERTPVPGVTIGTGPTLVATSGTMFGRVDLQATSTDAITFEMFSAPATAQAVGLSPRRALDASVMLDTRDRFAGITARHVVNKSNVVTAQAGVLASEATMAPTGEGVSLLSPAGWSGNWFSRADRRAGAYSASIGWEGIFTSSHGVHDVTGRAGFSVRHMDGSISETPVTVVNDLGQATREISFVGAGVLSASDSPQNAALRDLWRVDDHLDLDGGVRLDRSPGYGRTQPSARIGFRYAVDTGGNTVLRGGLGQFVGNMPLAVSSFSSYPLRVDRRVDPATGNSIGETVYQPSVSNLRLPRANAATLRVEQLLGPRLESGIGVTSRTTSFSPTLDVPATSGALDVRSTGRSTYREVELSIRRLWENHQQLFVSYVRSRSMGEVNDFSGLFQQLDSPLLQRGGLARQPTDAPNRVIAWGTFNLPRAVAVSPVFEWHSGFPYSVVDARGFYFGAPNSASFPQVVSLDVLTYKTVTVRRRSVDVGIQFYNLTNHSNPRDVYPVAGASRFGTFTNSVGTIARGYLMLKW